MQYLEKIKADTGISLSAQVGTEIYPEQKGLQEKVFARHSVFGGREPELQEFECLFE